MREMERVNLHEGIDVWAGCLCENPEGYTWE